MLLALLVPAIAGAGSLPRDDASFRALMRQPGVDVTTGSDGRVTDLRNLSVETGGDRVASALAMFAAGSHALFASPRPPELRLLDERESLTGSHVRFQQIVSGVEVSGASAGAEYDRDGRLVALHNQTARAGLLKWSIPLDQASSIARNDPGFSSAVVTATRRIAFNSDGIAIAAYRIELEPAPDRPWAVYIDAESGEILSEEPLFFEKTGRVFEQNPVAKLNRTDLRDNDNAASAVPVEAYSTVELPDLAASGPLSGPNVRIVDRELPANTPADAGQPLEFDRSNPAFEEVMAYFHLDRLQRYMQSLGYSGARQIVPGGIEVDPHAADGADNSYYLPTGFGVGRLSFGDGGVDDAEDPDILAHEYGHAIQDSIAPSTFTGSYASQGRALGEGFGDYWAFSSSYLADTASGRDPFCIGDWDARCGDGPSTRCGYSPGADCLRRVDGTKTMDDYITENRSGIEHSNGEIWSSALREFFLSMVTRYGAVEGKKVADRIVLESHFGAPATPLFRTIALAMLSADRALHQSANSPAICSAFTLRKILVATDCDVAPHGDLTQFQATAREIALPDANSAGIRSSVTVSDSRSIERVMVRVDIDHPFRGDLALMLFGPDGRSVALKLADGAPGAMRPVTYGLDVDPREPLSVFAGMPASGTWTLQVADTRSGDVGRLVSWGLILRFAGGSAMSERGKSAAPQLVIPAVARTEGANGTHFVTDVRVWNRSSNPTTFTAYYTATGNDGRLGFSAMNYALAPGQLLALDDVVSTEFRTAGVGNIEITGDLSSLLVTSRTYNDSNGGTFGQFIPATTPAQATSLGEAPLHIGQLENTIGFRTNIGFAEVAGEEGVVAVRVFSASNAQIASYDVPIPAFSHIQISGALGSLQLGGTFADAARATVTVTSGAARVVAYGSVVDNVSGDPIYIPAVRPDTSLQLVPAAFRVDGDRSTHWRSDLWLTNPSADSIAAHVSFHDRGGVVLGQAPMILPAGGSVALRDVIATPLRLGDAAGSLTIASDRPLLATTRSWTPGASGSFGQFIPAFDARLASGAGGRPVNAIELESSASYRTNLGAVEAAGESAVVRVRVFDAAGAQLFTKDVPLAAFGQMQFNAANEGCPAFANGRASFEVVSGAGRILAYASVVDNLSGDPVYIPAE